MLPGKGDLIVFREGGELIIAIGYVQSRIDFSKPDCKKRIYAFDMCLSGDPNVMLHFSVPIASRIQVCYSLKDIRKKLRENKWQIIYNTNPLQKE